LNDNICPACGTYCDDHPILSFFVSLEKWLEGVFLVLPVIALALLLSLGLISTVLFSILAALPVLVHIKRKRLCPRCGVEFEINASKSPQH